MNIYFAGTYGRCSLFQTKEEANDALEYLMHHATKERLVFDYGGVPKRMMEFEFEYCLNYSRNNKLYFNNPSFIKIMVEYGAKCDVDNQVSTLFNFLHTFRIVCNKYRMFPVF